MGLADRRGWRKEIHPTPQIQALFFSASFFLSPLIVGEHNSGAQFLLILGVVGRQPPTANPFFETSDNTLNCTTLL